MIHTIIVANSEVLRQLTELRELVTEYQLGNESGLNQFLKWSAIAVVLISIVGQYWIFKLNKNKEIKLQVAILYGKFKARSLKYPHILQNFNIAKLINDRNVFLLKQNPTNGNSFREILIRNKIAANEKDYDYYVSALNTEKLELCEIFHQIHFYYNNKNLEDAINDFTTKGEVKLIEVLTPELEADDYLKVLYEKKVRAASDESEAVLKRITDILLKVY